MLIYFEAPTKGDVLRRMAAALNPGGVVLLGATETVVGLSDALKPDRCIAASTCPRPLSHRRLPRRCASSRAGNAAAGTPDLSERREE